MEGMEKENIVRAFEHVQQIPASQEELSSNVLRYTANQNGVRACNIQNDWTVLSLGESQPLDDLH